MANRPRLGLSSTVGGKALGKVMTRAAARQKRVSLEPEDRAQQADRDARTGEGQGGSQPWTPPSQRSGRPELALESQIDIGDPANVRSPLVIGARGDALAQARSRMNMTAPRRNGNRERAIPSQELETRGPITERFRPPALRFPGVDAGPMNGDSPDDTQYDIRYGKAESLERSPSRHYDPEAVIDRLQGQATAGLLAPPQNRRSSPLSLSPLREEDVDQLWDWIRTEEDRAEQFFGEYIKTALHLHQNMARMLKLEASGQAIVRAIELNRQFIGLTIAWPINHADKIANLHLYIAPTLRQHIDKILPMLIEAGDQVIPQGLKMALVADRPGWEQLLAPLGFVTHTVLIRER